MNNEILNMLEKSGGIITNSHIVYTTGKHGSAYVNKDALYPHTQFTSRVGELFAEKHKDLPIDTVVAPALGGIVLSQWTAYYLSKLTGREITGVYTEKDAEKNQVFTRGYDKFVTGKNVLVIEDVTNTGGSVKKVIDSVRLVGGKVVAVSVMVNRSAQVTAELLDVPAFSALAEFPAQAWEEADCPLCQQGVPVNTSVGHGKKYLQAKGK